MNKKITIIFLLGLVVLKANAQKERLIKVINYENYKTGKYEISDSTTYSWSGTRSSSQDKMSSIVVEDYDEKLLTNYWLGSFNPYSKRLRTFDIDSKLIQEIELNWNTATLMWDSVLKVNISYTSAGINDRTVSFWNSSLGKFQFAVRGMYNYSGANLIEKYGESWNALSGNWENHGGRTQYKYLGVNKTEEVYGEWSTTSGEWENIDSNYFFYSGSDLIEHLNFQWDASGKWVENYRVQFAYSGGNLVEKITQIWKGASLGWQTNYRRLYLYTGSDLTNVIYQDWVGSESKYINGNKTDYYYLGGLLKEHMSQSWNSTINDWDTTKKYVLGYNTNNSITSITISDYKSGKWVMHDHPSQQLFYEPILKIEDAQTNLANAKIFPNPAKGNYVYVDYFSEKNKPAEIVIRNILGQVLYSQIEEPNIGNHSVMLPISSLADGLYFVNIYMDGILNESLKMIR